MLHVDRAVLINRKCRVDRLTAFRLSQAEKGWPLPDPVILEAIEGDKVGRPGYFCSGGGAWGCLRSHITALERAIMDDVGVLLMLEDDVTWMSDAWGRLTAFVAAVPADWDVLMVGGQHIAGPVPVAEGVVKCRNTQRTHAYAVRGAAMKDLLRLWYGANSHADWQMGPWLAGWNAYAPAPFIFGQAGGQSDISGAKNPAKFWSPPPRNAPVIHLTAPAATARAMRGYGLHMGFDRDRETGYDVGLNALVGHGSQSRGGLRRWLDTILWEAASAERLTACVWHPAISAADVRAAWHGEVIEVRGETAAECLGQLPNTVPLNRNYAGTHIIILRGPRSVAEGLRPRGWHGGNWRDDNTGYDNGLRQIDAAKHGRPERLAEWVTLIAAEAEEIPDGVPTVWHPNFTIQEVMAASGGRLVLEITAATAEDAMRQFREVAG